MKEKNIKIKSISHNAIMNGILSLSTIVFPLITFPYVCRTIGVEVNGRLAFSNSVITYFSMFATLGLTTYGIKACARVRDEKKKLSSTVKELLYINLFTTLITIVALIVSILTIDEFNRNAVFLLIYSINMILSVAGLNWFFTALEQYDYITIRSIIFKLISLVLMFIFVHSPKDSYIYACITVFANAGSNICNILYSRKFIDYRTKVENIKRHIKPTLTFFATTLASNIYSNLDTIMLGFIKGDHEVGIYFAATKIKVVLITLVVSVGNVLMPRMSYYVAKKDKESFNKTLKKSYAYLISLALPVAVFFMIMAKSSVLLLSGEDYAAAAIPMVVLMPILVTTCISNITGLQILIPLGKEKKYMIAVMIGALVDLILNFILMKPFGAVGAAIATLIAECLQLAIQFIYTKKYLKKLFHFEVTIKAVIATAISALTILIVSKFGVFKVFSFNTVEKQSFVELIILGAIFVICYITSMFIMKCSIMKDELNRVKKMLKF